MRIYFRTEASVSRGLLALPEDALSRLEQRVAISAGHCRVDLIAGFVQGYGSAACSLRLNPQKGGELYYLWIPEAKAAGSSGFTQCLSAQGGRTRFGSRCVSKNVQRRQSCLLPLPDEVCPHSEPASRTVTHVATCRQQMLHKTESTGPLHPKNPPPKSKRKS